MAARFVSVDRDTPMLLPPDLRDWVPEDDLVHFEIGDEFVVGYGLDYKGKYNLPYVGVLKLSAAT